jgi:hypothetical protein
MEALMRAIDKILKDKNTEIDLLRWENERLRKENAELNIDIEKYKENEVNRI